MLNIFKEMDVLKIFRMQEPVSKELLCKSEDHSPKLKEEKENTSPKVNEQIKELLEENKNLKNKNHDLERTISISKMDENEFKRVMDGFESLIVRMIQNAQTQTDHTSQLQHALGDLAQRYNHAKHVIIGLKSNEDILKKQLSEYEKSLEKVQMNYEELKTYAQSKLKEANEKIDDNIKDNVQEVARLKSRILESQVRISDLEKGIKVEAVRSRPSVFDPLDCSVLNNMNNM